MSAPRFRSGTFKRRENRVPGGRRVVHYNKKKPSKHVCAKCGKVLDAVPRGRPYEIRKLSKNQRIDSAYKPFVDGHSADKIVSYINEWENNK